MGANKRRGPGTHGARGVGIRENGFAARYQRVEITSRIEAAGFAVDDKLRELTESRADDGYAAGEILEDF